MIHNRFGSFRLSDYCTSWVAMSVLLLFSIVSLVVDLPAVYVVLPMVYAAVWLLAILSPHREKFSLCDNSIRVYVGKKNNTILIPSELTIVVSYADICPPLTKRTAIGNKTHILKDKYAVSILKRMPLDMVLEALHRNHIQMYTTSTIQTVFDDYRFIYSFVCDQHLFEKLITNRNCLVVIPVSLLKEVSVQSSSVDVYIDMQC